MAGEHDAPMIIIGGGIGGLAAALAIARTGRPVQLFERSDSFGEIGAGIQLGPNIFNALEALDLREAVLADAWLPGALEMRDALDGHQITRMPLGKPLQDRFGQPYAVIHRADLHHILLDACADHPDIALHTGCKFTGYSETATGVIAHFDSHDDLTAAGLIGADGLWSQVRETLIGDGKPNVSGHIAYRAVLKKGDVPTDLWSPDVVLWAGPKTHLVHYPLRRGDLYNLVVVFHSDAYVEGWDAEGALGELDAHFAGQRPEVLRLLEKIDAWRMWVLCDREPVKDWARGHAVLLGDAAHPMLQYLAQGACMATEDAVTLAIMIARHDGHIPKAFAAYAQARYLRTARVQTMARIYGEFYHAAGVKAELRDIMLGGRTPEQAYEGNAWLYGHDARAL